jgi:dolichol-phosphate mannosyltransferase
MRAGIPDPTLPPIELLSVVIPARDEEACIRLTVKQLHTALGESEIPHEIVVVDDGSKDATWKRLTDLEPQIPELKAVQNTGEHGF